MLVLNFSHPLTGEHQEQIAVLAGAAVGEIRAIPVQIDQLKPLEPQIHALLDMVQLTPQQWRTQPLLINPPGYAPVASALLAELHGRIGHFPSLIRLRPKPGPLPAYEVAELLDLQALRESASQDR